MLENYNSYINVDVTRFFLLKSNTNSTVGCEVFDRQGKLRIGKVVIPTQYTHPLLQPLSPAAGIAAGGWFGK